MEKETIDYPARHIADNIYHHILRDFIAHANKHEVLDRLYKFYTESDLTIISKQQLRVYQEIEKTVITTTGFLKNG